MLKTFTSSLLSVALLTILCILQISPTLAIRHPTNAPTYTDFLYSSCKTTQYPELCYKSLSSHASAIKKSPEMLANTALSVTLNTTRATTTAMSRMSNGPGLKPREAVALRDCLEELTDAVSELQGSIKQMDHMKDRKNLELKMSNIETWVSAALTDADTCMNGFGGKAMDGKLKTFVRGKIVNICHLASNSLALVNRYASSMHV